MSTGDLKNNVEKLRSQLRSIHYNGELDIEGVVNGKPETFLPLLNFVLLQFSKPLAKYFISKGYKFYNLSDSKFIETVYKLLLNEFSYNPSIGVVYFLSGGFAERKVILTCDTIKHCKRKHNELARKKKVTEVKESKKESTVIKTDVIREQVQFVLTKRDNSSIVAEGDNSRKSTEIVDENKEVSKLYDLIRDLSNQLNDRFDDLQEKIDTNFSSLRERVFLIERRVQTLEENNKPKSPEKNNNTSPKKDINRSVSFAAQLIGKSSPHFAADLETNEEDVVTVPTYSPPKASYSAPLTNFEELPINTYYNSPQTNDLKLTNYKYVSPTLSPKLENPRDVNSSFDTDEFISKLANKHRVDL
ncbi:hypothetical protein ABK040_001852 [Willaertia magna]